MKTFSLVLVVTVACATAPQALAGTEAPVTDKGGSAAVVLGASVGAFLPQVSSELGTHVMGTVEAGYVFSALDGRMQVFGSLSYTQPRRSQRLDDPRVPGGSYEFTTIQREFAIDAGLLFRFLPIGSRFNGYASLAPRIFLLQTESYGEAQGEKFGTNTENSTKIGFCFALGGEVVLGPGRLLLQAAFSYSQLQHDLTGNVPTGAIVISAGYRLFL